MARDTSGPSAVLTIRVSPDLNRRLNRAARARRRTRSEAARDILETALAAALPEDPSIEARRQSKLASRRPSERDTLAFIARAADIEGWE
jgi:predicted transcriptional regulator